jgi:hypothetical protein
MHKKTIVMGIMGLETNFSYADQYLEKTVEQERAIKGLPQLPEKQTFTPRVNRKTKKW